jgi:tripartite-type tricarboxylate transporter receptor subunit TctC
MEEAMSARRAWRCLLAALGTAFALWGTAEAQPIVGRPVMQIVVGGPPGGLFDIALRIVSERLGRELDKTVVIENKPGAGTAVALSFVKNAKPDGLTVAMINVSAAANESLIKNRGYDLLADFEPVGLYSYPSNVLIVNPALGADSVESLASILKQRGSAANYSSGGVGSPGHLAGELFKARVGVPVTHVPYKGAPPAVLAVMTGEVDFMFATASSAIGQITAGKVRALAVTTAERLPQLPNVPTMMQARLTDFSVSDWTGFLLPKGSPPQSATSCTRRW